MAWGLSGVVLYSITALLLLLCLTWMILRGSVMCHKGMDSKIWRRFLPFSAQGPQESRVGPQAVVEDSQGTNRQAERPLLGRSYDGNFGGGFQLSIRYLLCDNLACGVCERIATGVKTRVPATAQNMGFPDSQQPSLPATSYMDDSHLPAAAALEDYDTMPQSTRKPTSNSDPSTSKRKQLFSYGEQQSKKWSHFAQQAGQTVRMCEEGPGDPQGQVDCNGKECVDSSVDSDAYNGNYLSSSPSRSQVNSRGSSSGPPESSDRSQDNTTPSSHHESSHQDDKNVSSETQDKFSYVLKARPLLLSRATPNSFVTGFSAMDIPFVTDEVLATLERHLVIKRVQHEMGLPLVLLRSLRAFLPPPPSPFQGFPRMGSVVLTRRPQTLPFISVVTKRRLEQQVKKMVQLQRWGLPGRVQKALRHLQPDSHCATDRTSYWREGAGVKGQRTGKPRQLVLHVTDAGGDPALKSPPYSQVKLQIHVGKKSFEVVQETFPKIVENSQERSAPEERKPPLPKLIAGHSSCPQQRNGPCLYLRRKTDCVEMNIKRKHIHFLCDLPTLYTKSLYKMVSRTHVLPAAPPRPYCPVVFSHAPTPFLELQVQEHLESHVLRKRLQHQWGLPRLAQWSLLQFLPQSPCSAPRFNSTLCTHAKVKTLPGSSIPFITLQTKKQLEEHIKSKIIERRWGLPKRVMESLHGFMPLCPGLTKKSGDSERASGPFQGKKVPWRPPTMEAPNLSKDQNTECPQNPKHPALQRHVTQKALEIHLELLSPTTQPPQARKYCLPKTIQPGLKAQEPRPQELFFVDQAVLSQIELNIIHKDLTHKWGLPTLYQKSLSCLFPNAPSLKASTRMDSQELGHDFTSAEALFIGQGTHEDLEWHVKRKQLQHIWGLPRLAQRSLRSLLPAAPHLYHQQAGHVEVSVLQAELDFLHEATIQELERNVRKRCIFQQWQLPRRVVMSLRMLYPEHQLVSGMYREPLTSGAIHTKDGAKVFNRVEFPEPPKARIFSALGAKPLQKLEIHLAKKFMEGQLGSPPVAFGLFWQQTPDPLRRRLPKLILRGQKVLQPRNKFCCSISTEGLGHIELTVRCRHLASLWELGTRFVEAYSGLLPSLPAQTVRRREAAWEPTEVQTKFLPEQDRAALELHVKKKKLQHEWKVPVLVQRSLQAFLEEAPEAPAQQKVMVHVHIIQQQLSFLCPDSYRGLELHIQKRNLQRKWGLPKQILQSLRLLSPEMVEVSCTEHGTRSLRRADSIKARPQQHPVLKPKALEKMELHLDKKCVEVQLGVFPALVKLSRQCALTSVRHPLPKLIPPGCRPLQPRSALLPFARREEVDRIELVMRCNHFMSLWGLGRSYVEALGTMMPKPPFWPLKVRREALVLSPMQIPFFSYQEREALELHIRKKRIQHNWGLPSLVQRSLAGFMCGVPAVTPLQKTLIQVQTMHQELLFLPTEVCNHLEEHLQSMVHQRQWGLPQKILRFLMLTGQGTQQPHREFLPFVHKADRDQSEVAVPRNHYIALGRLDMRYVEAGMVSRSPLQFPKWQGADVVFLEVETPFLQEEERDTLELHVKKKKLQHEWKVPVLVQRSLQAFLEEAPEAPAQQKVMVHVHIIQQQLSFLCPDSYRGLELHIQKRNLQRKWGLPKRILQSLRLLSPEMVEVSCTEHGTRSLRRADSIKARPQQHPVLKPKALEKMELHLDKKCVEVQLGVFPALVKLSRQCALRSVRHPLPKLIPPGCRPLQPRSALLPFARREEVDRIELVMRCNHFMSLWGLGRSYVEALGTMMPKPPFWPLKVRREALVLSPMQIPFFSYQEREALELHIRKKRIQHNWGLPSLVQRSLAGFMCGVPAVTPLQKTLIQVQTMHQQLLFLPTEVCNHLEEHLQSMVHQRQWGLPQKILQFLMLTGQGTQQPHREFLPFVHKADRDQSEVAVPRNHYIALGRLDMRSVEAGMVSRSPLRFPKWQGADVVFLEVETPFLQEEERDTLELHVKKKTIQHLWGSPRLVQRSLAGFMCGVPAVTPLQKTLIQVQTMHQELLFLPTEVCNHLEEHLQSMVHQRQWGLPQKILRFLMLTGQGTQQPHREFLPFVHKADRDQSEVAVPRNHYIALGRLDMRYVEAGMVSRSPLQFSKWRGADVVFLEVETPFLQEEERDTLELHVKKKTIQHLWGSPRLVQRSLAGFMCGVPAVTPLQKTLIQVQTMHQELLFLPTEVCNHLEEHLQSMVHQRQWGLPQKILRFLMLTGQGTQQPHREFLPFVHKADRDQSEVAVPRNHYIALGRLDMRSVEAGMVSRSPLRFPKWRGADVVFLEVETPFLQEEERDTLELHVKKKTIQHLWGSPRLVQRSLVCFMHMAPSVLSHKKSETEVHVLLKDILFLPLGTQSHLEHHIQRLKLQQQWGLPRRVLRSLKIFCPSPSVMRALPSQSDEEEEPSEEAQRRKRLTDIFSSKQKSVLQDHLDKKYSQIHAEVPFGQIIQSQQKPEGLGKGHLPTLVHVGQKYPPKRDKSLLLLPPNALNELEPNAKNKYQAFAWGLPGKFFDTQSRKALSSHDPDLISQTGFLFQETDIPFFHNEEKQMLEHHIAKKRIQHQWGLPFLIKRSLRAFAPFTPGTTHPPQGAGQKITIRLEKPFFLTALNWNLLENSVKKMIIHKQWGLPKRIHDSLRALSPAVLAGSDDGLSVATKGAPTKHQPLDMEREIIVSDRPRATEEARTTAPQDVEEVSVAAEMQPAAAEMSTTGPGGKASEMQPAAKEISTTCPVGTASEMQPATGKRSTTGPVGTASKMQPATGKMSTTGPVGTASEMQPDTGKRSTTGPEAVQGVGTASEMQPDTGKMSTTGPEAVQGVGPEAVQGVGTASEMQPDTGKMSTTGPVGTASEMQSDTGKMSSTGPVGTASEMQPATGKMSTTGPVGTASEMQPDTGKRSTTGPEAVQGVGTASEMQPDTGKMSTTGPEAVQGVGPEAVQGVGTASEMQPDTGKMSTTGPVGTASEMQPDTGKMSSTGPEAVQGVGTASEMQPDTGKMSTTGPVGTASEMQPATGKMSTTGPVGTATEMQPDTGKRSSTGPEAVQGVGTASEMPPDTGKMSTTGPETVQGVGTASEMQPDTGKMSTTGRVGTASKMQPDTGKMSTTGPVGTASEMQPATGKMSTTGPEAVQGVGTASEMQPDTGKMSTTGPVHTASEMQPDAGKRSTTGRVGTASKMHPATEKMSTTGPETVQGVGRASEMQPDAGKRSTTGPVGTASEMQPDARKRSTTGPVGTASEMQPDAGKMSTTGPVGIASEMQPDTGKMSTTGPEAVPGVGTASEVQPDTGKMSTTGPVRTASEMQPDTGKMSTTGPEAVQGVGTASEMQPETGKMSTTGPVGTASEMQPDAGKMSTTGPVGIASEMQPDTGKMSTTGPEAVQGVGTASEVQPDTGKMSTTGPVRTASEMQPDAGKRSTTGPETVQGVGRASEMQPDAGKRSTTGPVGTASEMQPDARKRSTTGPVGTASEMQPDAGKRSTTGPEAVQGVGTASEMQPDTGKMSTTGPVGTASEMQPDTGKMSTTGPVGTASEMQPDAGKMSTTGRVGTASKMQPAMEKMSTTGPGTVQGVGTASEMQPATGKMSTTGPVGTASKMQPATGKMSTTGPVGTASEMQPDAGKMSTTDPVGTASEMQPDAGKRSTTGPVGTASEMQPDAGKRSTTGPVGTASEMQPDAGKRSTTGPVGTASEMQPDAGKRSTTGPVGTASEMQPDAGKRSTTGPVGTASEMQPDAGKRSSTGPVGTASEMQPDAGKRSSTGPVGTASEMQPAAGKMSTTGRVGTASEMQPATGKMSTTGPVGTASEMQPDARKRSTTGPVGTASEMQPDAGKRSTTGPVGIASEMQPDAGKRSTTGPVGTASEMQPDAGKRSTTGPVGTASEMQPDAGKRSSIGPVGTASEMQPDTGKRKTTGPEAVQGVGTASEMQPDTGKRSTTGPVGRASEMQPDTGRMSTTGPETVQGVGTASAIPQKNPPLYRTEMVIKIGRGGKIGSSVAPEKSPFFLSSKPQASLGIPKGGGSQGMKPEGNIQAFPCSEGNAWQDKPARRSGLPTHLPNMVPEQYWGVPGEALVLRNKPCPLHTTQLTKYPCGSSPEYDGQKLKYSDRSEYPTANVSIETLFWDKDNILHQLDSNMQRMAQVSHSEILYNICAPCKCHMETHQRDAAFSDETYVGQGCQEQDYAPPSKDGETISSVFSKDDGTQNSDLSSGESTTDVSVPCHEVTQENLLRPSKLDAGHLLCTHVIQNTLGSFILPSCVISSYSRYKDMVTRQHRQKAREQQEWPNCEFCKRKPQFKEAGQEHGTSAVDEKQEASVVQHPGDTKEWARVSPRKPLPCHNLHSPPSTKRNGAVVTLQAQEGLQPSEEDRESSGKDSKASGEPSQEQLSCASSLDAAGELPAPPSDWIQSEVEKEAAERGPDSNHVSAWKDASWTPPDSSSKQSPFPLEDLSQFSTECEEEKVGDWDSDSIVCSSKDLTIEEGRRDRNTVSKAETCWKLQGEIASASRCKNDLRVSIIASVLEKKLLLQHGLRVWLGSQVGLRLSCGEKNKQRFSLVGSVEERHASGHAEPAVEGTDVGSWTDVSSGVETDGNAHRQVGMHVSVTRHFDRERRESPSRPSTSTSLTCDQVSLGKLSRLNHSQKRSMRMEDELGWDRHRRRSRKSVDMEKERWEPHSQEREAGRAGSRKWTSNTSKIGSHNREGPAVSKEEGISGAAQTSSGGEQTSFGLRVMALTKAWGSRGTEKGSTMRVRFKDQCFTPVQGQKVKQENMAILKSGHNQTTLRTFRDSGAFIASSTLPGHQTQMESRVVAQEASCADHRGQHQGDRDSASRPPVYKPKASLYGKHFHSLKEKILLRRRELWSSSESEEKPA